MGTMFYGEQGPTGWWGVSLPDGKKGWIRDSEVRQIPSEVEDENILRQELYEQGLNLLGWYYLWGGRRLEKCIINPVH
jgi:hypothetical protein